MHLQTISHEGRFWDVFLEFRDDPRQLDTFRALLCYCPVDSELGEPARRTTTIIIESSYDAAVSKAQAFEEHQLQGLLRSLLPGAEE
jgi:apolipoprotein N-acyltransferase